MSLKTKKQNKKQSKKKQTKKKYTYKNIKLQSINLKPSLNINSQYNDDNTYKSVFSNNKKINKDIIFLKKTSFDIFYSNKYKYPLLVSENITKQTGKGTTIIKRSEIEDKWELDTNVESKNTLTFDRDYDIYEYYGGSAGHNAPALNHKLNIDDYIIIDDDRFIIRYLEICDDFNDETDNKYENTADPDWFKETILTNMRIFSHLNIQDTGEELIFND